MKCNEAGDAGFVALSPRKTKRAPILIQALCEAPVRGAVREGLPEQMNLQSVRGEAKPYQIRQFMRIVARYNLRLEPES